MLLVLLLLLVPIAGLPHGWSGHTYEPERTDAPTPPSTRSGSRLGAALAVAYDTAAVGAPGNRVGSEPGAGEVHVYLGNATGRWHEQARLTAPTPHRGAHFGAALAMTTEHLVVAAPGHRHGDQATGTIYLYQRSPETLEWRLDERRWEPDTHGYGTAVAIDATTVAVGSPSQDLVHVYNLTENGRWVLEATLHDGDASNATDFGRALDLDGDHLAIGAPTARDEGGDPVGAVHVFKRTGDTWKPTHRLTSSTPEPWGHFGQAVAFDDGLLAVGAPQEGGEGYQAPGRVHVLGLVDGTWHPMDRFGSPGAGPWARFGTSVALSAGTLVAGALSSDKVQVFGVDRQATWHHAATVSEPLASFGMQLAISHGRLLVGAPQADTEVGRRAGAVSFYG